MTPSAQVSWTEAGQTCTARWRSESGAAPPKRVVVADDTMTADAAYRLACEGTALLWRGDFQNARQLLQAMARRVDKCLEVHGARWMRSYISSDRKRVVCEFEAADAENVRESYRSAGIQFERVWTADVFSRDEPAESY